MRPASQCSHGYNTTELQAYKTTYIYRAYSMHKKYIHKKLSLRNYIKMNTRIPYTTTQILLALYVCMYVCMYVRTVVIYMILSDSELQIQVVSGQVASSVDNLSSIVGT